MTLRRATPSGTERRPAVGRGCRAPDSGAALEGIENRLELDHVLVLLLAGRVEPGVEKVHSILRGARDRSQHEGATRRPGTGRALPHCLDLVRIESIEVEYDAFPGLRLPAEITEVGTEASLTTRTFPITLSMNQPADKKILAGMAGIAHIAGRAPGENTGGYVIPISAFKGDPQSNQSHLWVVGEDNRVSSREVTVGRVTDGGILVTDGLQAGDLIATAGVHVLSEGQEVIVNRTGG